MKERIRLWLKYPYFFLKYDPLWDKRLNELMDRNEFTATNENTTTINGLILWIADHPYCSFVPIALGRPDGIIQFTTGRPSRATIEKASKIINLNR